MISRPLNRRAVSSYARKSHIANAVRRSAGVAAEALENRVLLAGMTPVFRYQFDEGAGTTVTDTGSNAANPKNNGTLVGDKAPTWLAGPSGNAGDFALQFYNFANGVNNPYFKHLVTGAVITAPGIGSGPFAEGLVQLSNNVDPITPSDATPDLSSVLNGSSSLAAWVKTTAVGDNNSWAAPSITGAEGRGLTNDIRWGYLDASGHIGIAAGDAGGVLSSTAINDGTWHLVVLSRDATTREMSVWVDGALAGRAIRTNAGANGDANGRLFCHFNVIGAATDTGNGNTATIEGYNVFNGALDDVRVFDHALTQAEVQSLLPAATTAPAAPSNPAATLVNGLVKLTWTDNANNELSFLIERTTPDSANPNSPDNSKWTQVGSAGAASGTGQQGTFTDVSSAYSGAQFFYRVRAFNSFNGGSFSTYATTTTPIAIPVAPPVDRYQFNEGTGTTTADSGTPGGNAGTLSPNPPAWVAAGPTGDTALNFNGTDSYVQLANNMGSVVGNNASVTAWVKTTASNTGAIAGTAIGSAPIALRWGFIDATGHVGVGVGTAATVVSNTPVNDGQWHLVAMTRDTVSGEIKIYVDGSLDRTANSETGSKIAQFSRIGATTNVGQDGVPDNTYTYFNGQLDDVRFYNSVLGPTDIAGLLPQVTSGPAAPTNFTATGSGGAVTLSWRDNADNEFRYTVLRASSPTGPFTEIAKLQPVPGSGTTVTFTDITGGHPGDTAYYQVAAFNSFNGGTTATAANTPSYTFGTAGAGVEGHYFNQAYWAGDPTVTFLAGGVNASWPTTPDPLITNGGRASTIFSGRIKTTDAGTYTFVSNTDDDGYLFVNGVLVSQDPGGHGERNATNLTPLTLAANTQYDFVLYQTNSGGGAAGAHLLWVTPAMTNAGQTTPVLIPSTNLSSESGTPATPTDFTLDPNFTTPHSVDFTFNANNVATVRYQLQRSGDGGKSWLNVGRTDLGQTFMDASGTVFPIPFRIEDATAVPGQSYQYRLLATNFDHSSAPTPAVTVNVAAATPQDSGVQVRYYNGELVSDRNPLNFAVTGPAPAEFNLIQFGNIDVDYTASSPDTSNTSFPFFPRVFPDSFSTVWTGKIRTDAAGVYTFITNSDDDAVMYVNGVKVSEDLGAHGPRNATTLTPLTLAASTDYNFVIIHNDRNANSQIHALWIEPGQTTPTPIPPGFPGSTGGFLQVMTAPYQQSVSASGVITENPAASAAGSLTAAPPASGSGVTLNWADQSLSELWFEIQRTTPDAANPNNPNNANWTDIGRAGMNGTTFTDATATPGATYFYRVRGANFDAVGPFSNVVKATASSAITDTVTGTAGNDTITLKRDADGTHIDWTFGAASGQVLINSPTGLTINGGGGTDTLVLDTINGNPLPNLLTLNGSSFTINSTLAIGPGQTVVVGHSAAPNGATLDLQGLSVAIDLNPKLDLKNNTLKVHYTGASPANTIAGYLTTGYAGGAWNGNGIQSSDAAASGGSNALGWGDAAGVVTVKYTRNGDANLDGNVDFTDLVALAQNYNTATGNNWSKGDFTYDGAVNFNDLVALAQNYNTSLAAPAVQAPAVSAAALEASILPRPAAKPAAPKPVARPPFSVQPVSKSVLQKKAAPKARLFD
jgi:hypothetical protein